MKKLCLSLCALLPFLLTSCASYQATPLSALDPECVRSYPELEDLSIGCKAYTKQDCYDYLDRDVIQKGYQPIQLTFHNRSDKHYVFSTENISLPCVSSQDIAKKVHTSTVGRVLGYSAGGVFVFPLFIPAVVDGIKSSNANTALDNDFDRKARKHFVITPGSFTKTLIFVPKTYFLPVFDISLLEEETGRYKSVALSVMR